MTSKALIPILVGMMLLTGVCNTLLTKYQDMQCVDNCSNPDPSKRKAFEQPVWQTIQMFIGEMGCWLVVGISAIYQRLSHKRSTSGYQPVAAHNQDDVDGSAERDSAELQQDTEPIAKPVTVNDPERRPLKGWRVILLALPAICDICGTTLMNVGLLFVAASIYQMTRGALVLFVGLFSVLFLKRRLAASKWLALFIVVAGVAIVGLAGVVEDQPDPLVPGDGDDKSPDFGGEPSLAADTDLLATTYHHTALVARSLVRKASEENQSPAVLVLIGVLLIALAQVFTASQFVLEESIMHRFSLTPLAVVGWEGTFGLIVTLIFLGIMHAAYGSTPKGAGGYFDARQGWTEMTTNKTVWVTSLLIMVSIGGFNFFGLSVTRTVSATSRSTIDTCRTLFIWIVSLGLGWESFKWLQVVGFAALVYGTFLFNDIVSPPRLVFWRRRRNEAELLPERPIEHQ